MHTYGDRLFRMGLVMLKNEEDAKDALQNVLIKYMQKHPDFLEEEHRKAWILRVYSNECKDSLRYRKRHQTESFEDNKALLEKYGVSQESCGIIECMQELPCKYKEVLHMFYVEEYQAEESAKILQISPAAVRKRLQRGREQLKKLYEARE